MQKWLFIIAVLFLLVKFIFFSTSPKEYVQLSSNTCPLPPTLAKDISAAPQQSAVPPNIGNMRFKNAHITPQAGFALSARVLSKREYRTGKESDFSPVDFALGWQAMAEDRVLQHIEITQKNRWYHWRVKDINVPISKQHIAQMSSNMHFIPATKDVWNTLRSIKKGDKVKIEGWLVNIDAENGYWHTSLSRNDIGAGACEIVLVCRVEKLNF